MKYLLILIPFLLFGQYSDNKITNPGFETFTGTEDDSTDDDFGTWSEVTTGAITEATADAQSGTYAFMNLDTASGNYLDGYVYQTASSLTQSTTHRWKAYFKGNAQGRFRIYDSANSANIYFSLTGITGTTYQLLSGNFTTAANFTNAVIYSYGGASDGDSVLTDDVELREQLTTLYIDANQADDTDNDTTKTLTEAFVTRGAHSGGTFVIVAGTYDESVTIDSSFTLMDADGVVIITAVDFNDKTCSVDYEITIGTATNDDNVTYLTDPSATKKRGYDNNGGYGNYLR